MTAWGRGSDKHRMTLTRTLLARRAFFPYLMYALQLDRGRRDVNVVERELIELLPAGTTYNIFESSVVEDRVERAVKPEALALGVFGIILAVAALVIAGQLISAQLRMTTDDLEVLRSLGADRRTVVADGLTPENSRKSRMKCGWSK